MNIMDLKVVARPDSNNFPLLLSTNCPLTCCESNKNIEAMNCTPIKKLNWNEQYKYNYNNVLNQQFDAHAADEVLLLIPININHAIDKLNECIICAEEHSQPKCIKKSKFK